jgi:hypothetical protein
MEACPPKSPAGYTSMNHFAASPFAVVSRWISSLAAAFAEWTTEDLDPRSPAAQALAYDAYIRNNVPGTTVAKGP